MSTRQLYLSSLTLVLAIVGPQLCAGADEIAVVTERNVAVPMRDGVILRANVFRPDDDKTNPVLVMRFPNYGRNHNTAADQNADAELVSARQTVHHGNTRATRILLPRIPNAVSD